MSPVVKPIQGMAFNKRFQIYLVPLFQNESSCKTCHENEFHFMKASLNLQETDPAGGTYFPVDGFARSLVMTYRQEATRK